MQLRLDDRGPADALGETELLVLHDGDASGADHFQRAQMQRIQRRLDDVQGGKVFCQLTSTDRLHVAEIGQIPEFWMPGLDVDESRDFL